MKVAKRTDSKSSHHKGKNSVTMYGDRCELDLLWPSCNKYMNSESLCYTRETNMLIIPQFKKSTPKKWQCIKYTHRFFGSYLAIYHYNIYHLCHMIYMYCSTTYLMDKGCVT